MFVVIFLDLSAFNSNTICRRLRRFLTGAAIFFCLIISFPFFSFTILKTENLTHRIEFHEILPNANDFSLYKVLPIILIILLCTLFHAMQHQPHNYYFICLSKCSSKCRRRSKEMSNLWHIYEEIDVFFAIHITQHTQTSL